ncbi:MAG: hypothetical protein NC299_12980 [Lachnospiraceae bacterium]|nr:hypothetical protein [Ruminococcus sp.]MCM1276252.1 hypothetical protein [Lachnospiraceae bacterium]
MKLIKEYGPSIIVTFIIGLLVFIAQFPYLAGAISFVFADCVIGYWYKSKIISNKAKLKAQASITATKAEGTENKCFNSDYYDLYYDFNYNQLMLMLKATCMAFSLCPILCDLAGDTISYISTGMTLAVCMWAIASIVSVSGKGSKVILKLRGKRKDNWFSEYTQEELDILNELQK